ncbi:hypothetical protein F4553_003728 [Allocatelliglobosispora scoriae]|uniref:TIR domain-containing protein n=1 Tax=Allocatelliglobosispora scoriae TaxID=643052 RepID=A0A841BT52_9ACTN|nr:toll/interleukin-1 receptor domain-containing protein [Allocatelliglobosispora scoriae]MBB5870349.1 hypothetical protein [Allocatelliglobosispora scoriae]
MTGHVFISYSHGGDSAYVKRLADHLTSAGIPVWFDRDIITGTRWERVIRDQIDTCAALIVVMTPQAEESEWISLEINRAVLKQRPILPLLLAGDGFFRLSTVQHENVTGGRMPSAAFISRLRAHQGSHEPTASASRPQSRRPSPLILRPTLPSPLVLRPAQGHTNMDFWSTLIPTHTFARAAALDGDHSAAVRLYRMIVDRSAEQGQQDDPRHLDARTHLAYHLGESGDRTGAVRLFGELIADRTRLQGADRADTLWARHHHARNVGESGDRAEAVRLLQALIADRTRLAGFPGLLDAAKELDKKWLAYFSA